MKKKDKFSSENNNTAKHNIHKKERSLWQKISFRCDYICCFIGMCLLEDLYFLGNLFKRFKRITKFYLRRFVNFVITKLKLFSAVNGIDFTEKRNAVLYVLNDLKNAYKVGFTRFFVRFFHFMLSFIKRFFKCIFGSVNYVAPILACVMMFVVVSATLDMTFALEVNYNGETLGYIEDESVYYGAEKEMLKRVVFEDYKASEHMIPQFKIRPVKNNTLSDVNDITDNIIKASGNELTEASGLYVNGEFMGALEDPEALDEILYEVKEPFMTDDPDEKIEFVKNVECREGIYPITSIVTEGYLHDLVNEEQSQKRIYTAVSGDSPILIAQKNGIPYSQLKSLNPNIEKELFVGQEILVEKAVPMLEVKVVKTVTYEEDINFKIQQIQDPSQYQGYVDVIQNGKKGVREVTAEVTYIDGIESEREVLYTEVIKEPVTEKIVVGGKRPLKEIPSGSHTTSDHFIWPAPGGRVTCLFGSAGYPGHTGLDIGRVPMGSPVVASASGTVVRVRYNTWGYGYHVIIDHGGNIQTLYAHCSKIYVKVGDWVEQGQVIAGMGRTGNATGIHVHFEIRDNGKYMNPADYIGLR